MSRENVEQPGAAGKAARAAYSESDSARAAKIGGIGPVRAVQRGRDACQEDRVRSSDPGGHAQPVLGGCVRVGERQQRHKQRGNRADLAHPAAVGIPDGQINSPSVTRSSGVARP